MTSSQAGRAGRNRQIVSGRVVLRELRREDLEAMERWPHFREPDLQWANFDLHTPGQKDAWFRQELYDPARRRFAILAGEDLVGVVGLRHIDFRRGRATLGIRLSAGEVNKGYGTEAIVGLLAYAFGTLRLRQVDLDVAEGNHRAIRCYEKCGFRQVSRFRDYAAKVFVEMSVGVEEFERNRQKPLPS